MIKILHLDRDQRMISAEIQHLLLVGKKIVVSFIAPFMAILAKVKKIWFVDRIGKMIMAYNQKLFWIGHCICGSLGLWIIIIVFNHNTSYDQTTSLLFTMGLIYAVFYLLLQHTRKDENGESNWP